MKRLLTLLACLLLLVLAAHAAAARWAGVQAEQEVRRLIDRMEANPGVAVSDVHYARGWYASESGYTLSVPLGTGRLRLRATDTIHHGPLVAGQNVTRAVGLARIESSLALAGARQPAITGSAHVAINGQVTGYYSLSALVMNLPLDKPGLTQLETGSGTAELTYDPQQGRLEIQARLDAISLTETATGHQTRLTGIQLHQQGARAASASANGQIYSGAVSLAVQAASLGELRTGPGRLSLSFDRIGRDAWSGLLALLEKLEATGADGNARNALLLSNGLELLPAFIQHGPRLGIEELYLDMLDQGVLESSASLDYPVGVMPGMFNPLVAMHALNAQLNVAAPRVLVRYLLQRLVAANLTVARTESGQAAGSEEFQRQTQAQTDQALDALSRHPLIQDNGERLRTQLALGDGKVLINGKPAGSLLNLLLP